MEDRCIQQQVAVHQRRLHAEFVAVDEFARERRVIDGCNAGAVCAEAGRRLHAIEVEAAGLVASRGREERHERLVPAIGRLERSGPLRFAAVLRSDTSVVQHVRPGQAHVANQGRYDAGEVGRRYAACRECSADLGRVAQCGGARRRTVRIAVDRIERLVLVRVAQANGQVERVGGVEGLIGEQGQALCILLVTV